MRNLIFFVLISISTIACNNPQTTVTNNEGKELIGPDKALKTNNNDDVNSDFIKTSDGRDYTHKRGEAISILEFRNKKDPSDYPIISDGIFEYGFIHDGRKMSQSGEHNNEWLDFKTDQTYEYGKELKTLGGGKYHYEFEKNLLLMLDNDKSANPQEWEVKRQNNVMILVGTTVYGNNNFQMKLMQHDSKEAMIDSHIKK